MSKDVFEKIDEMLSRGMTQTEISKKLGISRQQVYYVSRREEEKAKRRSESTKNNTVHSVQYAGVRDFMEENNLFLRELSDKLSEEFDYLKLRNFLCRNSTSTVRLINNLISVTGKSYEELFMSDEKDSTHKK